MPAAALVRLLEMIMSSVFLAERRLADLPRLAALRAGALRAVLFFFFRAIWKVLVRNFGSVVVVRIWVSRVGDALARMAMTTPTVNMRMHGKPGFLAEFGIDSRNREEHHGRWSMGFGELSSHS